MAKEENDVNQATYETSAATLAAAQANSERLEQLEDFKKITAPFAGTIAARNVDIGTLVSSGSGTSGALAVQSRADRSVKHFRLRPADQFSVHADRNNRTTCCPGVPNEGFRRRRGADCGSARFRPAPCSRSWRFRITTAPYFPGCTRKLSSPYRKQTLRSSFLPRLYLPVRRHTGSGSRRRQSHSLANDSSWA